MTLLRLFYPVQVRKMSFLPNFPHKLKYARMPFERYQAGKPFSLCEFHLKVSRTAIAAWS